MKHRVTHQNLSDFPEKKVADGFLCLNCNKMILSKRARKYCSNDCTSEWLAKHSHQWMRAKLLKERGYICAHCEQDKGSNHTMTMDHILPIALGGEEFDQANLQLLCKDCNKIKTRQDMKNIALGRKGEKLDAVGQLRLSV